ncbi:MAG: DUF1552 domain-containing protein [Polyangiaceae bacterium]
MSRTISRRTLLRMLGTAGLALPFARWLDPKALRAEAGFAKRLIIYYHPDGVAGQSQNGDPSLWHATGPEHDFQLGALQQPLAAYKDDCVFLNGLTMGPTDSGSHPGGAKKLLTATDGGNGRSIDQVLADSVGADAPFRHLYLGAHANVNNASGDKHVSYTAPGVSITPEDDPRRAFDLLFEGAPPPSNNEPNQPTGPDPKEVSVIDGALAELNTYRDRLGNTERAKLDLHLESLREVEKRIKTVDTGTGGGGSMGACEPALDVGGLTDQTFYDPTYFPDTLKAQMDLMVLAMACGLTKVGVIQASQHTSELIMSRFPNTEMYDPGFDMRSHQASHYGASHDYGKREFDAFVKQGRYWVSQFAYLLEALKSRPEGDGTMLDNSIVLYCTEVCDGNTHLHDDMPFVLAGKAGGRISTGRLLNTNGRRHADLLVSIAQAMGHDMQNFGDNSSGPIPGLV